jgi:hypothetical protein
VTGTHEEMRPALRIVRGAPTAEEIAALVTVLAAVGGGEEPSPTGQPTSQWAPPSRLVRTSVAPSGWWESALPR